MLTTALPPSALADKPWFSFLHRWVAVLLLGFIASVASLNVYATTVGTKVTIRSVPPVDPNFPNWVTQIPVGPDAEYNDGGLAVDIDPLASTIKITWTTGCESFCQWTPPKIAFDFSGGTLDQITGVTRTGGTAGDAAGYLPTASGKTITITTPTGTVSLGTIVFTFTSTALGATPTLTSVSPSSGSTAGGTSVTLTGTNLTGATVVSFGGTAATNVTVNSATQITATTPAHAAGAVNVAVTTPGGTATLTNGYTYAVPPPIAGPVSATVAANSSANPISLNLSGGAATSVVVSVASHGTASASGTSVTYTPTADYSGADSFSYTASNAGGTSAPATVTLTVSAPMIWVSPILSNGTVGTAYSTTVLASGGAAPYTYTITAGSLPTGLSLSAAGNISGTPTVANTFQFAVTATDANSATGSRAYNFGVAATAPSAPTIGTATAGDAQASVAFTAPASNGGSAIIGYTATAISGGQTGSCMASPCTVTGLSNGTSYAFIVTATNSAGTGAASGVSNAVTPKGSQTITFANPGAQSFGTSPTLTATADSVLTPTFTSSTTGVCTITSSGALTFVAVGSCTIDADQAGNGSYLAAAQVSQTFTVNPVVPGAPTIGTATAGDAQALVTFTAPAFAGGAAITGYTVTGSPGGSCAATAPATTCTVTGLSNGTAYTFTVKATNSAGTGAASGVSNAVTPKGSQSITFANPNAQNFGTSPTLTATAAPGLAVTFTSSTTGVCTITSGGVLTLVSVGNCTIHADQAGNDVYLPATQVSQTFTVNAVVPGAPSIGTATAGDAQASVAFTAPAFAGGAAITGYTVTSNPGAITGTGAGSPLTVTGLTNGTPYTFTVTATNSAGTGAASLESNSVTPVAIPVTGVCGSAHGVATLAAPSANWCNAGAASSVTSAAASFTWDCAGSNGGTTAQCSAPRQYQVTASAGANGSITPSGVQTLAYNATPSFTITPAALYRIDSVSGCSGTLVGNTYTTAAVVANCTVNASFVLISHAISATAQPRAGGSVTCSPGAVGEGGSATCTATANTGYVFQKWTGACAGQAAACSLTNATAPQTSAALFQQEQTGLTVPEGSQQGKGLALVLEPSANNWVIQSASTATVASTGTSTPSGVELPHGLVNLKLVTGNPGTSASVVLTYPQALPAGTKYYKFGQTAAKRFNHWYEFSGAVISGNTITLTIVDGGEGDNDLTANSEIDDPGGPAVLVAPPPPPPPPSPPSPVQLQISTSGAGTVQRSVAGSVVGTPGSTTTVQYPYAQAVTLTAQAQTGARFTGWSGACSGLLACSLTLYGNQSVQASFTSPPPAVTCRARAFSANEERLLDAYLAYYGRPADVAGLAYWRALADARGDVGFTIDAFSQSIEFQRRFGQMNGVQLIANLYQQMYGRQPDPAGASYYGAQLASGQSSLVSIAIHIFDGRLGRDRLVVDNRRKVARHFVTRFEELGSAAPVITDAYVMARLVSAVDMDAASAQAGCALVDQLLDKPVGE